MINKQEIDDLCQQLLSALPAGLTETADELKQSFRTILEGAFNKLDLVTRSEFDSYVGVLERTRTMVEELKAQQGSDQQNSDK